MNYTVNKLAVLSGVTVRTLRFYDQIDLLKPASVAENGYRSYQEKELLKLQQILFFREVGFELKDIKAILADPTFDQVKALHEHKKALREQIDRTKKLIRTIETTIGKLEGKEPFHEDDIFDGLVNNLKANQQKTEAAWIKYQGEKGKEQIEETRVTTKDWTTTDWQEFMKEINTILNSLTTLITQNTTHEAPETQELIRKHFKLISTTCSYDKESYLKFASYLEDPEQITKLATIHPGLAIFMATAMKIFAEQNLA